MANNRIVQYTQFFSESILFYFILIPVFAISQNPYPFWSYLLITGLCIILFDMGLWIVKNYAVYIPVIISMFCLMYYVFHYPVAVILLWLLFMTWRTIHFNRNGPSDNQITILVLTMLMLFIGIIFFNHLNLIWLAVLQLVMTLCGYWLQLLTEDGTNTKPIRTALTLGTFGIVLLAGGGLIYGIYPFITGLTGFTLSGIGALFEYTVLGIANTANELGLNFSVLRDMADEEAFKQAITKLGENTDELNEQADMNGPSTGSIDLINGWTFLIAVIALIPLTIYLYRKKFAEKIAFKQHGRNTAIVSTSPIQTTPEKNRHAQERAVFGRPNNPIRKKVFKLEQQARANGLGRKPSETVEEWFSRLKMDPSHLDLYQKVRYGDKTLTHAEQQTIHDLLDELREQLKR